MNNEIQDYIKALKTIKNKIRNLEYVLSDKQYTLYGDEMDEVFNCGYLAGAVLKKHKVDE